jgi:hypothetical protein
MQPNEAKGPVDRRRRIRHREMPTVAPAPPRGVEQHTHAEAVDEATVREIDRDGTRRRLLGGAQLVDQRADRRPLEIAEDAQATMVSLHSACNGEGSGWSRPGRRHEFSQQRLTPFRAAAFPHLLRPGRGGLVSRRLRPERASIRFGKRQTPCYPPTSCDVGRCEERQLEVAPFWMSALARGGRGRAARAHIDGRGRVRTSDLSRVRKRAVGR